MRKSFTLLVAVLLTATVWAQSPQKMSYQAVIRDGGGALVTTQVGMRISILKGSDVGTAVYVETQTPTPNASGLVTIVIGNGTVVSGSFSTINWSNDLYFIKTEVATAPPLTTYTITGASQLLSVPYALYSNTAGTAVSGTGNLIHYIGELYGGGIVVAVWKVGAVEHGLIASLADIAVTTAWSDVTDAGIGLTAQSPIDGQANSNAIILQSTATSAADLCDQYTNTETGTGVFSDWYLPATWELNECYNAAFIVNSILGPTAGFQFLNYWSSTEAGATNTWFQLFDTGYSNYGLKTNIFSVRAVRKF